MNFLFTISIRNLLRQKRRSVLLGSAIAFGTAILVLANAFSHGISEVLFNEIVSYVAGHVSVNFSKNGNINNPVFNDGKRIMKLIREQVGDDVQIEEAIGTFARAIGTGKADNVIMVGIDPDGEATEEEQEKLRKNFKLVKGTFEAISDSTIENPVALAVEKAKALNVSINDILRVRFTNINGQVQAARLTVTTIFKPSNVFMSAPVFLNVKNLREILGYGPHDIPQLQLQIEDPKKNAIAIANKIHAALAPPLAVIDGTLASDSEKTLTLLALRTDSASQVIATTQLSIVDQCSTDTTEINRSSVIIPEPLAKKWGIGCGDTCTVTYPGKFSESQHGSIRLIITTVAKESEGFSGNVILVNEKDFYHSFYDVWPQSTSAQNGAFRPDSSAPLYATFGGEWLLLERAKNTKEVMKQYREIAQKGWKAVTVSVGSMYETASSVLNLEVALNLITFVCVMVLFFIILIGVINTLRMTIRERTREIGTVRAIGMQRNDVRNSFLIETGLLALVSALAGTVLAFIAMAGLSQLTINTEGNPMGMLLVDGHLFFAPTVSATLFFILIIVAIALFTAFFPARRAAKLSAADALRHFE